jgi:hypothetical protein
MSRCTKSGSTPTLAATTQRSAQLIQEWHRDREVMLARVEQIFTERKALALINMLAVNAESDTAPTRRAASMLSLRRAALSR